MNIGQFQQTDNGYIGDIYLIDMDIENVRIIPTEGKHTENSPDFIVMRGRAEIGAGWTKHPEGDKSRSYVSVRIDNPGLKEPISAFLYDNEDDNGARLVWRRPEQNGNGNSGRYNGQSNGHSNGSGRRW